MKRYGNEIVAQYNLPTTKEMKWYKGKHSDDKTASNEDTENEQEVEDEMIDGTQEDREIFENNDNMTEVA